MRSSPARRRDRPGGFALLELDTPELAVVNSVELACAFQDEVRNERGPWRFTKELQKHAQKATYRNRRSGRG